VGPRHPGAARGAARHAQLRPSRDAGAVEARRWWHLASTKLRLHPAARERLLLVVGRVRVLTTQGRLPVRPGGSLLPVVTLLLQELLLLLLLLKLKLLLLKLLLLKLLLLLQKLLLLKLLELLLLEKILLLRLLLGGTCRHVRAYLRIRLRVRLLSMHLLLL